MGRHHLPLSGPWCPYCNKGGSFQIRGSFLRWNAMPSQWTRWWASCSCEAKFQCLYSPKAVSGRFDIMLLWKLKVLTKQVTAPWHEGERLQSDLLASWQQTSQIVLSVSKSLPKAWDAAGYEERGWQFDGNIVVPYPSLKGFPQADDSCLPELENAVGLKVTRWCREGAISKTALRDSTCLSHLQYSIGSCWWTAKSIQWGSSELTATHFFTNIPVRKLEHVFL